MRGIERREVRRHRPRDGGHRRGRYQRWGFGVESGRPSSFCTSITLRRPASGDGRLDPFHEGVVAEAVLHDQARRADRRGDARARLESMRVGVRVALDRAHAHVRAADLCDHVRVLVLGADGENPAAPRCARARRGVAPPRGERAQDQQRRGDKLRRMRSIGMTVLVRCPRGKRPSYHKTETQSCLSAARAHHDRTSAAARAAAPRLLRPAGDAPRSAT